MEDPIAGLIHALAEHMRGGGDWSSFAMVLSFDSEEVNGVYGYTYAADGTRQSVTASPYRIKDAVKEYTDSYFKPGDPLPLKILVQFDRTQGEYEVTFEDKDSSRWKVTPATIAEIPEQLRPRFS